MDFVDHRFQGPAHRESNSGASWFADESELFENKPDNSDIAGLKANFETYEWIKEALMPKPWGKLFRDFKKWRQKRK